MKGQHLVRAEDGHRIGQMVQGLVMGRHVPLERFTHLFGFGHIQCDCSDPAAFEWPCGDLEGAALSLHGHPSQGRTGLDHLSRFSDQGFGPAIKGQTLGRGLFKAHGIGCLKPGLVGPDQSAPGPSDPGGSLLTV